MSRPRLPFVGHLTCRQIFRRYQACRCPTEKVRWRAVWLLALLARADQARAPAAVAVLTGLSACGVRLVLHRWNDHGPDGLADRRKRRAGAPKVDGPRREALFAALRTAPPGGGAWTGPKVARYVADRWGVAVSEATGFRLLRAFRLTLRPPRLGRPQAAARPTRRRWGQPRVGEAAIAG
jgi:transposase